MSACLRRSPPNPGLQSDLVLTGARIQAAEAQCRWTANRVPGALGELQSSRSLTGKESAVYRGRLSQAPAILRENLWIIASTREHWRNLLPWATIFPRS
jgi:hypothetical protein